MRDNHHCVITNVLCLQEESVEYAPQSNRPHKTGEAFPHGIFSVLKIDECTKEEARKEVDEGGKGVKTDVRKVHPVRNL